jgi:hypothetical protein
LEALGGLLMTGIGLIITGILIINLALMWKNYTATIMHKIERWTNNAQ